MPPKRKQTPRNGFFYFMQDFKNKQGRNYRSMQEVADAAGPHWARMSKEQRRPFEEKALMERNHMKISKMTSEGLDVEQLEMEDKREQERIQMMKEDINFNLKVSAKSGRLHKETFFIIHINIFCYCSSQDRYYPAEIAIAGFSLDDGVKEECVYHKIIKPGALPLGYACEANMHSKETHQLPPPMTGDTDYNLDQVYYELREFFAKNCNGPKYPVLYTDEKMLKMVQQVLDTMCYDFESQETFKVYNLQFMFKVLRNTAAGDIVWPTDTYSIREIEKDVNAHAKGISCQFHENTNATVHCSLSVVKRYAFTICDNCCPDMQIPLVPGKHVPENSRIASFRSSSMFSLDSQSSQYSTNLRPTTREDDSESVVSVSSKSGWDNRSVYADSSTSSVPHLDDSEDYPPLGDDTSRNSWKTYSERSNPSSIKSVRSYAGVMGPSGISKKPAAMPSSLCDNFGKLDVNDSLSESSLTSDYPVLGRGRGRGKRF